MIYPIVEGHGEVSAVPVLMRRIAGEFGIFDIQIGTPIRRHRSQIAKKDGLRVAIDLSRRQPDCTAVVILFDADELCVKTEAAILQGLAVTLAQGLHCRVIIANKEFEAWFLASLQAFDSSLSAYASDPDQKRGAKGEFEQRMGIHYNEPADQPKYCAKMDLALAYNTSRSFRKFVKEFHALLEALGCNPKPMAEVFTGS